MKTIETKGLHLAKLILVLRVRDKNQVSANQMFWECNVRNIGIQNLKENFVRIHMQLREWEEMKKDKGDKTEFKVGDRVRYHQDGRWEHKDDIAEVMTQGSARAQSYYIKNDDGHIWLQPRMHVRIQSVQVDGILRNWGTLRLGIDFESWEILGQVGSL